MDESYGKRCGMRTFRFASAPVISGAGSIAGVREGLGPQYRWFDRILTDDMYGEKSFEKAESGMLRDSIRLAIEDAGLKRQSVDVILSGDLLNQLMSSSFMARDLGIPYLGIYGACATMTQAMLMAGVMVDGGYCSNAAAAASSHFASAERQFRMPLEHGNQRPPQAQWTATAAGAVIISDGALSGARRCRITAGTIGRVIDPAVTDTNFMGAAMAPAAFDTIMVHLKDLGRKASDYDMILTGDLGKAGKKILLDLADRKSKGGSEKDSVFSGFSRVYEDCGAIMYDDSQDSCSGASGCGCSASIFAGRVFKEMNSGKYSRVMLVSTGALLSTISSQQGETIPGIAHAVTLEVF